MESAEQISEPDDNTTLQMTENAKSEEAQDREMIESENHDEVENDAANTADVTTSDIGKDDTLMEEFTDEGVDDPKDAINQLVGSSELCWEFH